MKANGSVMSKDSKNSNCIIENRVGIKVELVRVTDDLNDSYDYVIDSAIRSIGITKQALQILDEIKENFIIVIDDLQDYSPVRDITKIFKKKTTRYGFLCYCICP